LREETIRDWVELACTRIDHISFGISPWDTDGVKAELEKRGLTARIDTSTRDDIHVAAGVLQTAYGVLTIPLREYSDVPG
jgi:hypothetical protein